MKSQAEKNQTNFEKLSNRVENFRLQKVEACRLADLYEKINPSKAVRLRNCSSFLAFAKGVDGFVLKQINSCRVRLCPLCTARRSHKLFLQLQKVTNALACEGYRFIFLTLTVKNVNYNELKPTLDNMLKAYNKLLKKTQFSRAICGAFRSLEVVHDCNKVVTRDMYYGNAEKHIYSRRGYYDKIGVYVGDSNPNFKKFHPHFHVLLAVDKSYFTNPKKYIKQSDFVEMWQNCLSADYEPVCDVRVLKGDIQTALQEVSKYTVKSADILPVDTFLASEVVEVLDQVLACRRLVSFNGVFKEVHKALNLVDIEQDDLSDDDITPVNEPLLVYRWISGFQNYYVEE